MRGQQRELHAAPRPAFEPFGITGPGARRKRDRIAYCPAMALGHRPHQTTGALESYQSVRSRNEHYFLEKWRAHPEFFLTKP